MVKGGYGQISDAMASRLDVRLNSPVTKIETLDSGVSVTTSSGMMQYYRKLCMSP